MIGGKFITNSITTTFLLYHVYTHYKTKKNKIHSKHYPYVFIILALLLSLEQTFSFITYIPTYHFIKMLAVVIICFPFTEMSHKIYKEYILRTLVHVEGNIDGYFDRLGCGCRETFIKGYDQFFNTFKRFEKKNFKEIELKNMENVLKSDDEN